MHAAAGNFSDVEIAFLVHARAMHVEQSSGIIAQGAPGIEKVAVGVVLHHLRGRVFECPHLPVGADVQAVHR